MAGDGAEAAYDLCLRRFLNEFSKKNKSPEEDEGEFVQYRIASSITEEDLSGAVAHWALQYLYQHNCPYNLAASIARTAAEELKSTNISNLTSETSNNLSENNILLRLVHNKVHEVCERLKMATDIVIPREAWPVSVCAIKNARRRMEDRHVIVTNLNLFLGIEDQPSMGFYAVFDGHAGTEAASYAAAHLHRNIVTDPSFPTDIEVAFKDGFHKTDAMFVAKAKQEGLKSGSTAVCALVQDKMLTIAWLGDSLGILVRGGCPVNTMIPHKPDRQDERDRIDNEGGCVVYFGTWRVNGALAVSRAIGDSEFKPYVCSTPDVESFPLDGTEDFLLLACDGLWDVLTAEDVTRMVYSYVAQHPGDVDGVAQNLVQTAKERNSGDNISVIVVFFKSLAAIAASNIPIFASTAPLTPPVLYPLHQNLIDVGNGESPTKIITPEFEAFNIKNPFGSGEGNFMDTDFIIENPVGVNGLPAKVVGQESVLLSYEGGFGVGQLNHSSSVPDSKQEDLQMLIESNLSEGPFSNIASVDEKTKEIIAFYLNDNSGSEMQQQEEERAVTGLETELDRGSQPIDSSILMSTVTTGEIDHRDQATLLSEMESDVNRLSQPVDSPQVLTPTNVCMSTVKTYDAGDKEVDILLSGDYLEVSEPKQPSDMDETTLLPIASDTLVDQSFEITSKIEQNVDIAKSLEADDVVICREENLTACISLTAEPNAAELVDAPVAVEKQISKLINSEPIVQDSTITNIMQNVANTEFFENIESTLVDDVRDSKDLDSTSAQVIQDVEAIDSFKTTVMKSNDTEEAVKHFQLTATTVSLDNTNEPNIPVLETAVHEVHMYEAEGKFSSQTVQDVVTTEVLGIVNSEPNIVENVSDILETSFTHEALEQSQVLNDSISKQILYNIMNEGGGEGDVSQTESVSMDPVIVESIPENVPVAEDVVDDESEDGDGWKFYSANPVPPTDADTSMALDGSRLEADPSSDPTSLFERGFLDTRPNAILAFESEVSGKELVDSDLERLNTSTTDSLLMISEPAEMPLVNSHSANNAQVPANENDVEAKGSAANSPSRRAEPNKSPKKKPAETKASSRQIDSKTVQSSADKKMPLKSAGQNVTSRAKPMANKTMNTTAINGTATLPARRPATKATVCKKGPQPTATSTIDKAAADRKKTDSHPTSASSTLPSSFRRPPSSSTTRASSKQPTASQTGDATIKRSPIHNGRAPEAVAKTSVHSTLGKSSSSRPTVACSNKIQTAKKLVSGTSASELNTSITLKRGANVPTTNGVKSSRPESATGTLKTNVKAAARTGKVESKTAATVTTAANVKQVKDTTNNTSSARQTTSSTVVSSKMEAKIKVTSSARAVSVSSSSTARSGTRDPATKSDSTMAKKSTVASTTIRRQLPSSGKPLGAVGTLKGKATSGINTLPRNADAKMRAKKKDDQLEPLDVTPVDKMQEIVGEKGSLDEKAKESGLETSVA